jgi:hypothetical protein
MLWTICVILIVLWLLGLVTSTTMGGLIHILLVIAIIMILVNVIGGRRRAWPRNPKANSQAENQQILLKDHYVQTRFARAARWGNSAYCGGNQRHEFIQLGRFQVLYRIANW